jgi:NAD(P)-dependent dehydrogenase (short-subunit alcohol dehydrogenase family)
MSARRICIVGGCGGIGRSVVKACLDEGDQVAVMDLQSSLDRHPPPAGTLAIAVDGSDEASVTAAFNIIKERWGALDGLINAAGFLIAMRPLAQTQAAEFDTTITGNLRTTFLVCKAAMALLERGDAPSLINIASGLGSFIRPHYGPYAASKAGMIALTKTLALEHAPTVRANAVGPGAVDTAFLRGGTGRSEERNASTLDIEAYSAMIPLRRIAVAEDIVGPVMFLLGAQSGYMTGQTLWVNGGAYMP